jgi:hypothetical protein
MSVMEIFRQPRILVVLKGAALTTNSAVPENYKQHDAAKYHSDYTVGVDDFLPPRSLTTRPIHQTNGSN